MLKEKERCEEWEKRGDGVEGGAAPLLTAICTLINLNASRHCSDGTGQLGACVCRGRHAHWKWAPSNFLSQVDFECNFQKTKNSRIIFSIFDTITPVWFKSFSVSYHQLLNSNLRSLSQRQTCFHTQCCWAYRGNGGLIVRESDCNPKVASSSLRSSRNCWWGEWMSSTLSTLNTTTEVPFSKSPNPQLLSGSRSINATHCSGCVFTVCVCSLLFVCT